MEAIPYALRTIFALETRVRPYNKYLEWELHHHPLEDWDADSSSRCSTACSRANPRLSESCSSASKRLPAARASATSSTGGSRDLDWLRGTAEYRA